MPQQGGLVERWVDPWSSNWVYMKSAHNQISAAAPSERETIWALRVGDGEMFVFPSTVPLGALQSGPSQAPNRAVGLNDRPRVVVL